jgi:hypothetical protein
MTLQPSLMLNHRRSLWIRACVRRTPSPGSGHCSRPGAGWSRRAAPRTTRTGAPREHVVPGREPSQPCDPLAPGTTPRARHERRSAPTGCTWRAPWYSRPLRTRDRDRSRSPGRASVADSSGPTMDRGRTTSGRHQTPPADVAGSHCAVSYEHVRGDVSWSGAASSGAEVSCGICTHAATTRNVLPVRMDASRPVADGLPESLDVLSHQGSRTAWVLVHGRVFHGERGPHRR